MTMMEAVKLELAMRTEEYNRMITRSIELLSDYDGRPISTHLGHNLASRAAELSVLAGKIESIQSVLRFLETENR